MVSLVIPPKDDINRINKLLTGELGTAANIKSRVTRQSVLTAITSTRESKFTPPLTLALELKLYK